ncbi:MAG: DNA methylase [Eubacterium sp.]|nr:DNA methylase [Eubacterium sp.]
MADSVYIAIDLKSFYASVECMERELDPMTANLVVADESRTNKTICLAVSPSLKAYGIPGRARLFEVVERVREINATRAPEDQLTYITAPPQMALYLKYSARIYEVYLKYIAPEDIHVYSIDEVMFDATHYLGTYQMTPEQLASKMIMDVYRTVGIPAAAGIGTNLYLCKVAMDIMAKHAEPDENGVRIARLDEMSYRRQLWTHEPITDFWRVGRGYAKKLAAHGLYTMGDVARCSIGAPEDFHNEELLYRLFGVNAELLIDHAWGYEPCTMEAIKAYKPENNSIVSGQVLRCPYEFEQAELVVREMADLLALDLVEKRLVTDQIVLTVGYDIDNLTDPERRKRYKGPVTTDHYGRPVPKHAHGTTNLKQKTASTMLITDATMELFSRIVDRNLLVRRISLCANRVVSEAEAAQEERYEQLSLFAEETQEEDVDEEKLERERKLQQAMLDVKKRYGKNAMVKGMNLQEGATTMERNRQIGGHKA